MLRALQAPALPHRTLVRLLGHVASCPRRSSTAALLVLACAGCGSGFPDTEIPRWLGSGGSPHVKRVRDLGTRRPPEVGPIVAESDGVASPGEYLLIEGSGF